MLVISLYRPITLIGLLTTAKGYKSFALWFTIFDLGTLARLTLQGIYLPHSLMWGFYQQYLNWFVVRYDS